MKTILTSIVGSRAHGTETPDSDTDTRSIYVLPTSEIVGIDDYDKFKENKETDTNSWELIRFINLSLNSNPNTLEVLLATPDTFMIWGEELRQLFPHFLCRRHVYNAFKGFATGQRKKLLSPDTNLARKPKSASHYLRVLYNGIELLESGTMSVRIVDTPIGRHVLAAKRDELELAEILEIGDNLIDQIDEAFELSNLPFEPNKCRINEFLLKVRKAYW